MSNSIKDNKKDLKNIPQLNTAAFSSIDKLLLNDYHTFLTKKVERLTSALYVITGFLPHDEPVRNRLRTLALDLVQETSRPTTLSREGIETFRERSTAIVTMLQTARFAGLISHMNADLLSEEYAQLATFVKEHSDQIQSAPQVQATANQETKNPYRTSFKGHNKTFFYNEGKVSKGHSLTNSDKGQIDRKKLIIELLNKKDKISIRDAVMVVGGVSEKTIQRELLSLIEEGLVIKEGERRWSTYSKAPPFSQATGGS